MLYKSRSSDNGNVHGLDAAEFIHRGIDLRKLSGGELTVLALYNNTCRSLTDNRHALFKALGAGQRTSTPTISSGVNCAAVSLSATMSDKICLLPSVHIVIKYAPWCP